IAGEADGLKEYIVGLDVFAKPESYDPRQESTVRMHVARLRQKLSDYYRTEGVDDAIFVDLPKGGFKVTFQPREIRVDPAPEPVAPAPRGYRKEIALVTALAVAVALAAYLGLRLYQIQRGRNAVSWTPELKQLWEPLISPDRPLIICLSLADSA